MDYYNFQNRNFSSGPHLLGAIMIFAGLFVLTTPYFLVITTQVSRVYWLSGGYIIHRPDDYFLLQRRFNQLQKQEV